MNMVISGLSIRCPVDGGDVARPGGGDAVIVTLLAPYSYPCVSPPDVVVRFAGRPFARDSGIEVRFFRAENGLRMC